MTTVHSPEGVSETIWRRCRERTDPAVAVHPGASVRFGQCIVHLVDGARRRVPYAGPGGGGPAVGKAQEQGGHELRQDGAGTALLLRQVDLTQGNDNMLFHLIVICSWRFTACQTLHANGNLKCIKIHWNNPKMSSHICIIHINIVK